jgi:COP9 signalosome complex subunit 6
MPKSGPTQAILPIHTQILDLNESAVLLGFHLEQVLNPAPGNPLPLTIYESNFEAEDSSKVAPVEGEDREMKDSDAPPQMVLRFRELPYTTETGEAEMIAMQFIREGVNSARVDSTQQVTDKKGKGKALATQEEEKQPVSEDANLTKEELVQIAALQTKANALKMMRDRIALLIAYLERLPNEYQATPVSGRPPLDPVGGFTQPSNSTLRQIQALVTNVELVTPAQQESLQKELLSETNDVKLISLVTDMLSSLSELRNVGKKFAVVEAAKNQRARQSKDQSLTDAGAFSGHSLSGVGDLML